MRLGAKDIENLRVILNECISFCGVLKPYCVTCRYQNHSLLNTKNSSAHVICCLRIVALVVENTQIFLLHNGRNVCD